MSHAASDWMPMEWLDFWSSDAVLGMSNDAALLYLWLLGWQWRDGSIPGDPAVIRRAVPSRFSDSFDAAWPQIEPSLPVGDDGRRRNPRCSRDLAEAAERLSRRASSGRLGGMARIARLAQASSQASLKQCSSNAQASLEQSSSSDRTGPDQTRTDQTGRESTPLPPPREGEVAKPPGGRKRKVRTPEQEAKAAEMALHREQGKAVWQAAWAEHRPAADPFEFAQTHSTSLRKMHAKHGTEKLRAKCDALLSDLEPWTHKNASPTLLVARWSTLGLPVPRRQTATDRAMQEFAKAAPIIDQIEAEAAARRAQS